MKIKSILFAILIIIGTQSFSQELVAMFKDKAYWGFMNLKGEVLVKPRYTYCRSFYSGMAKVGKTYFINIKGEKLKPQVRLMDAHQYHNGMVAVKSSAKWGYMNTSGKLVISAKYNDVTDFDGGFALISIKKKTFVINKEGKETEVITNDGKIGAIKKFSEGLAPIEINGKFGFVNEKGEISIRPNYLAVGYFKLGLVWARDKNGLIGFIDTHGNWIIEPKLIASQNFDSTCGVARVKTKKGWCYMNSKGEFLSIDKNIDVFKKFENGAALVRMNALWGYLNPEGGWLIEPQFSEGATPFKNDYARIKLKGKWGIINKKGEWVLQPTYDNIKPFFKVE